MKGSRKKFQIQAQTVCNWCFSAWLLMSCLLVASFFTAEAFAAGDSPAERLEKAGIRAFQKGDFVEAVRHWKQELRLCNQEPGLLARKPMALNRLAEANQRLGRYSQAMEQLKQAEKLAKQSGQKQERAAILASLGHICTLFKKLKFDAEGKKAKELSLQRCKSYLETGLELAEELKNDELKALLLVNQGNLLALLIKKRESLKGISATQETRVFVADLLKKYRQAAELAKRTKNDVLVGKALSNAAAYALEFDDLDTARAEYFLKAAARHLLQLPDAGKHYDTVYTLLSVGQVARRISLARGEPLAGKNEPLSYELYQNALKTARKRGDKQAESFALGYLGELYADEKRYPQAMALTQQAIFSAQEKNEAMLLLQWYRQKGRLHKEQGELASTIHKKRKELALAINAYRIAVSYLETVRRNFENCRKGNPYSFEKIVKPVYLELADLLLLRAEEQADKKTKYLCEPLPRSFLEPKEEEEKKKTDRAACDLYNARAAIERLKDAELRDYFQDECVTKRQTRTKRLERLTAKNTAVVYYILLPERAVALLLLPKGLQQIPLNVDPAELRDNAENLLRLVRNGASAFLYERPAKWLYEKLMPSRLEAVLEKQSIKTLVFVPDEHLRTLPMGLLYDDKDKKFLVEKYATAVTPSANLVDDRKLSRNGDDYFLLNGLSEFFSTSYGLPPLTHVRNEIETIKDLHRDRSTTLLGEAFTSSRMEQALDKKSYSVIHIASHSFFAADSNASRILTYDDELDMDKLEKLLGSNEKHRPPPELLTLSACATAIGEADAALGLAGVAVKAGASAVVGTLWQINDEAAALFITKFYALLKEKPRLSKARVLQETQLWFLKGEKMHYRNPYYWSPFLLIGNWF
ncbi:MAG: CHAT domain-containing protein [Gammaproteobacteria bacterium]|nr:CHAT domain-containing protein [Gammaproteobacteria bacterium]